MGRTTICQGKFSIRTNSHKGGEFSEVGLLNDVIEKKEFNLLKLTDDSSLDKLVSDGDQGILEEEIAREERRRLDNVQSLGILKAHRL